MSFTEVGSFKNFTNEVYDRSPEGLKDFYRGTTTPSSQLSLDRQPLGMFVKRTAGSSWRTSTTSTLALGQRK